MGPHAVTAAKHAAATNKFLLKNAVFGVNQVTRMIEQRKLSIVVFATNPVSSLAFGHVPMLCRMHKIPVCILHTSSKNLGDLFHMKSLAMFGLRVPDSEGSDPSATEEDLKLLVDAERRIRSISDFLVAKASSQLDTVPTELIMV